MSWCHYNQCNTTKGGQRKKKNRSKSRNRKDSSHSSTNITTTLWSSQSLPSSSSFIEKIQSYSTRWSFIKIESTKLLLILLLTISSTRSITTSTSTNINTIDSVLVNPRRPQVPVLHNNHHTSSSATTTASNNSSSKRHLSGAAEYFYANDKLADDQVSNFVNSLQHQNYSGSNQNLRSSQSSAVISNQSHRVSHLSASSVFPTSLLSRSSSVLVQSSPSPSLFSTSVESSQSSQPSNQHQHYQYPYSELSLKSIPSTSERVNSILLSPPSLPRHYNNLQNNDYVNNNNHKQNHTITNNFVGSSLVSSDKQLEWLQPVYIDKQANIQNQIKDRSPDKLQLNAFKSDSIDFGGKWLQEMNNNNNYNNNSTIGQSIFNNNHSQPFKTKQQQQPDNNNMLDGSFPEVQQPEPEIGLKTFSAALANVSFSLRDEQWVAPIIALSLLNIMVIVGFECFVIYRACRLVWCKCYWIKALLVD